MAARLVHVILLAAPLAAQAVHVVGPGGLAQIRDAIAVAAPGDVIEVAAGFYVPFTLDKPLTIAALPAPPGQLVVVHSASFTPTSTVLSPPAGTRAFVTGVHFRNNWYFWRQDTRVTRGTVCFEECTFESNVTAHDPALRVQDATVLLRRCLLLGALSDLSPVGLHCTNSSVFAIDCFIRGGSTGVDAFYHGAPGILADSSLLHLVRVDVVGGDSNGISCIGGFRGGPGLLVQGNSTAWLADCTLRGGHGYCMPGGHGLHNLSPSAVQLARTTATAGPGTPPGQATLGPTQQQPLLGLTGTTTGLVRGLPWVADYRTEPAWPIAVLLAPDVTEATHPLVAERLLLPAASSTVFALLVGDSAGNATLQTTVPALAVLQHQRAYLQAFSGLALPMRTQPALGGVIR